MIDRFAERLFPHDEEPVAKPIEAVVYSVVLVWLAAEAAAALVRVG